MIKLSIILFFVGIVAAQRSQFVDRVLDLQYAVGYIHEEIQDTTWQSHYDMSDELTEIVSDSMVEITNGLTSFLAMRERYTGYMEETRTAENTECVDEAMAEWPSVHEEVGAAIGQCGAATMDELHENVFGYHQFVNSNRQLKFDAQNIVLSALRELNPMTDVMELDRKVEHDIDEIYNIYQSDVLSGINERLAEFARLKEEVAPQVHDCIAEALNNLSSRAGAIIDEARNC